MRFSTPALFCLLMFGTPAIAARTAHFAAQGTNFTSAAEVEPSELTRSSCSIAITNSSENMQNYTLAITAQSSVDGEPGMSNVAATPGPNNQALSGTLNPGQSIFFIYQFAPMPSSGGTRTPAGGYTQHVTCKGSITAEHAQAQSYGALMANGTITTFQQSGNAQGGGDPSMGVGGVGVIMGSTTYSQNSIAIGNGRPF